MALNVNNLEGNEIADDYIRKTVPKGRWSDTWDVFKASFLKLLLLNIVVLVTFAPGILVVIFRSGYLSLLGMSYPFNSGILYPFVPDTVGLGERVVLSADLLYYSALIAAGLVASLGISGAAYCIRKIVNTHGECTVKNFFHGIKVGYLNTVFPVTLFMLFMYATLIIGDWKDLVIATGGNGAAAITAYVFIIIATVIVGVYSAWLFAVGTSYRCKAGQLFKNAFVLMIGTPLQTIIMAAFVMIPVWLFMIGGIVRGFSYAIFVIIGFSFILLSWTAFTQWAFDMYVNPTLKAAAVKERTDKSEKELAAEKEEDDKRHARELLAAGKSELIARPILPIAGDAPVYTLGKTYTRGDISVINNNRDKLASDIAAYEKEHSNDPVFAEYNKLFAEREKALKSDSGKKGKKKKISSDNLLK